MNSPKAQFVYRTASALVETAMSMQAQAAANDLQYRLSGVEFGARQFHYAFVRRVNRMTGRVLILHLFIVTYLSIRFRRRHLMAIAELVTVAPDIETGEDREFCLNVGRRLMDLHRESVLSYEEITNRRIWANSWILPYLNSAWWETIELTEDLAETFALAASTEFQDMLEAELREYT
jgi:hypothetical protein